MKSESQQPFLVLDEWFSIRDIQKSLGLLAITVLRKNQHLAALLHEEQTLGAIRRFFHPERPIELERRIGDAQFERRQWIGSKDRLRGEENQEQQVQSRQTTARGNVSSNHRGGECYSFKSASVTAPNEADVTELAYLASTPRV